MLTVALVNALSRGTPRARMIVTTRRGSIPTAQSVSAATSTSILRRPPSSRTTASPRSNACAAVSAFAASCLDTPLRVTVQRIAWTAACCWGTPPM